MSSSKGKVTVAVEITEEAKLLLKEMAKEMGLIVDRGPYVGQGNLSALIEKVARGHIVVEEF